MCERQRLGSFVWELCAPALVERISPVRKMRRPTIPTAEQTSFQLPPPPRLHSGISLFLDLDGTLLELVDQPDEVVADADLRHILARLHRKMDGRLAVVSGRSLAQIESILGPVAKALALSGSHGSECRIDGRSVAAPRPAQLDHALTAMRDFAARHEPLLVEQKTLGAALHYRQAPHLGPAAFDYARLLADRLDLFLQEGNMMVELRPHGHDKGSAIARMMEMPPLAGANPVFVGDDITDETGFAAVAVLGGYGVLTGEVRPSAARYYLPSPSAVRAWLEAFAR